MNMAKWRYASINQSIPHQDALFRLLDQSDVVFH